MNVDAKSGLLSVCESVCERRKREGKAMKPTRCTCDLPLCAGVNVLNTESREIKQRKWPSVLTSGNYSSLQAFIEVTQLSN